ncbi:Myb family DNA-binding domain-containing protein [Besnoitia besnoiti]|uniref:Myb family DNA-binding domain-containing protein n=1 Tax=Besnoitia besnoiti TaxID=94643 RepID=A0A2A9MEX1_BESBE|nr:Myb family DNA-binding domain-containing protein [Besnoitia besnoiti]PFH34496.1 Myb family DNA-binding domain-containing protein [Besnoitia besnoiti]
MDDAPGAPTQSSGVSASLSSLAPTYPSPTALFDPEKGGDLAYTSAAPLFSSYDLPQPPAPQATQYATRARPLQDGCTRGRDGEGASPSRPSADVFTPLAALSSPYASISASRGASEASEAATRPRGAGSPPQPSEAAASPSAASAAASRPPSVSLASLRSWGRAGADPAPTAGAEERPEFSPFFALCPAAATMASGCTLTQGGAALGCRPSGEDFPLRFVPLLQAEPFRGGVEEAFPLDPSASVASLCPLALDPLSFSLSSTLGEGVFASALPHDASTTPPASSALLSVATAFASRPSRASAGAASPSSRSPGGAEAAAEALACEKETLLLRAFAAETRRASRREEPTAFRALGAEAAAARRQHSELFQVFRAGQRAFESLAEGLGRGRVATREAAAAANSDGAEGDTPAGETQHAQRVKKGEEEEAGDAISDTKTSSWPENEKNVIMPHLSARTSAAAHAVLRSVLRTLARDLARAEILEAERAKETSPDEEKRRREANSAARQDLHSLSDAPGDPLASAVVFKAGIGGDSLSEGSEAVAGVASLPLSAPEAFEAPRGAAPGAAGARGEHEEDFEENAALLRFLEAEEEAETEEVQRQLKRAMLLRTLRDLLSEHFPRATPPSPLGLLTPSSGTRAPGAAASASPSASLSAASLDAAHQLREERILALLLRQLERRDDELADLLVSSKPRAVKQQLLQVLLAEVLADISVLHRQQRRYFLQPAAGAAPSSALASSPLIKKLGKTADAPVAPSAVAASLGGNGTSQALVELGGGAPAPLPPELAGPSPLSILQCLARAQRAEAATAEGQADAVAAGRAALLRLAQLAPRLTTGVFLLLPHLSYLPRLLLLQLQLHTQQAQRGELSAEALEERVWRSFKDQEAFTNTPLFLSLSQQFSEALAAARQALPAAAAPGALGAPQALGLLPPAGPASALVVAQGAGGVGAMPLAGALGAAREDGKGGAGAGAPGAGAAKAASAPKKPSRKGMGMSGWALFAKEKRAELQQEGTLEGETLPEQTSFVARFWHQLSKEKKAEWGRRAEELNRQAGLRMKKEEEIRKAKERAEAKENCAQAEAAAATASSVAAQGAAAVTGAPQGLRTQAPGAGAFSGLPAGASSAVAPPLAPFAAPLNAPGATAGGLYALVGTDDERGKLQLPAFVAGSGRPGAPAAPGGVPATGTARAGGQLDGSLPFASCPGAALGSPEAALPQGAAFAADGLPSGRGHGAQLPSGPPAASASPLSGPHGGAPALQGYLQAQFSAAQLPQQFPSAFAGQFPAGALSGQGPLARAPLADGGLAALGADAAAKKKSRSGGGKKGEGGQCKSGRGYTAFTFFAKEMRQKCKEEGIECGSSLSEQNTFIGDKWRQVSPEEKKIFQQRAKEANAAWRREHEEKLLQAQKEHEPFRKQDSINSDASSTFSASLGGGQQTSTYCHPPQGGALALPSSLASSAPPAPSAASSSTPEASPAYASAGTSPSPSASAPALGSSHPAAPAGRFGPGGGFFAPDASLERREGDPLDAGRADAFALAQAFSLSSAPGVSASAEAPPASLQGLGPGAFAPGRRDEGDTGARQARGALEPPFKKPRGDGSEAGLRARPAPGFASSASACAPETSGTARGGERAREDAGGVRKAATDSDRVNDWRMYYPSSQAPAAGGREAPGHGVSTPEMSWRRREEEAYLAQKQTPPSTSAPFPSSAAYPQQQGGPPKPAASAPGLSGLAAYPPEDVSYHLKLDFEAETGGGRDGQEGARGECLQERATPHFFVSEGVHSASPPASLAGSEGRRTLRPDRCRHAQGKRLREEREDAADEEESDESEEASRSDEAVEKNSEARQGKAARERRSRRGEQKMQTDEEKEDEDKGDDADEEEGDDEEEEEETTAARPARLTGPRALRERKSVRREQDDDQDEESWEEESDEDASSDEDFVPGARERRAAGPSRRAAARQLSPDLLPSLPRQSDSDSRRPQPAARETRDDRVERGGREERDSVEGASIRESPPAASGRRRASGRARRRREEGKELAQLFIPPAAIVEKDEGPLTLWDLVQRNKRRRAPGSQTSGAEGDTSKKARKEPGTDSERPGDAAEESLDLVLGSLFSPPSSSTAALRQEKTSSSADKMLTALLSPASPEQKKGREEVEGTAEKDLSALFEMPARSSAAPALRLDADGQLVMAEGGGEEIDQHACTCGASLGLFDGIGGQAAPCVCLFNGRRRLVEEGGAGGVNSLSLQPYAGAYKSTKGKKWTPEETQRFYAALEQYGTDLLLVRTLLPHVTDKQLKLKLKIEERRYPEKVEAALNRRRQLTIEAYEDMHGKINAALHYNRALGSSSSEESEDEGDSARPKRLADSALKALPPPPSVPPHQSASSLPSLLSLLANASTAAEGAGGAQVDETLFALPQDGGVRAGGREEDDLLALFG